ncbi:MAG: hypothetical protein Phog2KO_44780 [Phototrophicaceae bacterium]
MENSNINEKSLFSRIDFFLILILLLAGALRMIRPGLLLTWIDELNIITASVELAQSGDWVWLGNETSFFLISGHSPLTTYLSAIPALVSPHPFTLRLFYGLVGVIIVGLMYWLMDKTVGRFAGRSSALLVAVMPLAIYWSRFVWNPSLAPLFLIPWLYTGYKGYSDDNQHWAQYAHWIFLSLAIQTQTALLVIVPISGMIGLVGLWSARRNLGQFILRHLFIFAIVTLTLLPWLWGIYGESQGWWVAVSSAGDFDNGNLALDLPSFDELLYVFSFLTASATYRQQTMLISGNPADWWFPSALHSFLYLQSILIFCGSLAITAWQYRYKKERRFFALILTVSLFWSLILLTFNRLASDFYMMLTLYAGIALFGWITQILYNYSKWLLIVPVLMISAQLWLSLSILSWYDRDPDVLSYSETVDAVDDWSSDNHDVLVWEYNPTMNILQQREWILHWRILSKTYPIRYITYPLAIPIAENGQTIAGNLEDTWLSDWVTEQGFYPQGNRDFTTYTINRDVFPSANYYASSPQSFADMARIEGIYAEPDPNSNLWYVFIYWQPQQTSNQNWQFSLRLRDENSTLAQIDQTSLQSELWRSGDDVVSFLTLNPENPVLANSDIQLDLLMYSYPYGDTLPVIVDDTQANLGEVMTFDLVIP